MGKPTDDLAQIIDELALSSNGDDIYYGVSTYLSFLSIGDIALAVGALDYITSQKSKRDVSVQVKSNYQTIFCIIERWLFGTIIQSKDPK